MLSLLANSNAFNFGYIFKTIVSRWYYYVSLAVFVILLFSFFFIKKQPARNELSKTQKISYVAVLAALATVANIFDIKISDEFQISLVASVGFIAGYSLGGGYGFAVCFIGDLLGALINPHGPYNPIIGIGTGLWGLIPGIAFTYFKGNEYVKTAISFVLGFLLVSAGINIVGFCLMYPTYYTFEALLPTLPLKLAVVSVNAAICFGLVASLPRILPKARFKFDSDTVKRQNTEENNI
ncbi:MAG: folate family ECF transporter S component [Clostridia bacterium]|nr:folate family ECF transporter S component [Clostridia bacterium]